MSENFKSESEIQKMEYDQAIISRFSPEEQKIWLDIRNLIYAYADAMSKDKISSEDFRIREDKIIDFNEDLKVKLAKIGEKPYDYALWHPLVGSTVPKDIAKFDTPDHAIEKFIRSL